MHFKRVKISGNGRKSLKANMLQEEPLNPKAITRIILARKKCTRIALFELAFLKSKN